MRNTQATLYKIGKIVSFVLLGIYALIFVIYSIIFIVDLIGGGGWAYDLGQMIWTTIEIGLVIALMILAKKFEEEAKKAPVDKLAPVIILMAFGLVTGNLLYTVGGVFGIIAASQEKNGEGEQKEEPKEEPKEENK